MNQSTSAESTYGSVSAFLVQFVHLTCDRVMVVQGPCERLHFTHSDDVRLMEFITININGQSVVALHHFNKRMRPSFEFVSVSFSFVSFLSCFLSCFLSVSKVSQ